MNSFVYLNFPTMLRTPATYRPGVDRVTIAVYDERGAAWAAARRPVRRAAARRFRQRVRAGGVRADLGAGAGRYTADLGAPVVALDASATMLGLLAEVSPRAWRVRGDLEHLPLRRRALAGAWANMSYLHVPRPRLPLALAELHWATEPGAPYDIQVAAGDEDLATRGDDDVPGRRVAGWAPEHLADTLVGAGLDVGSLEQRGGVLRACGTRMRSLPDTVGPGMRVLVCGLNPSGLAADRGVGFARRSNRFWPCAVESGLVSAPFDARLALLQDRVGMTDLVKRATSASAALTAGEYRAGAARVDRLVRWLRPGVVCFVGLEGWRAAVDRRAVAGWQPNGFGGRPAYLMPSTTGRNANAGRAELIGHLRVVARRRGRR